MQIGVVGTILVHLLLIFLLPQLRLRDLTLTNPGNSGTEANSFDVQLAPPEPAPPVPPKPRFVETNPNAPDNVPDKTNNVAAQNQQVAQEKPTPDGKSDRPAITGEPDKPDTAIVSGQLVEPRALPAAAPAPPAQPVPPDSQPPPRAAEAPLPGTAKNQGETPEGLGTNAAPLVPHSVPGSERVEGVPGATSTDNFPIWSPSIRIDPQHPLPRPSAATIKTQARPTPLRENRVGTANVGLTGIDAKWSSYGEYLQRFIDSVQAQWDRILIQSSIYPAPGTRVTVVFRMNSKGEIAAIIKTSTTGGAESQYSCVSAITERSPYGPWSDDMIALLGQEQEMTFEFYYY